MSTSPQKFSANEKEIEALLGETGELRTLLSAAHEELLLFQKVLSAKATGQQELRPAEIREKLLGQLDDMESEYMEYIGKIHNHKHDVQGMRECDDVSCEAFFLTEHERLKEQIQRFLCKFAQFKNDLKTPPKAI